MSFPNRRIIAIDSDSDDDSSDDHWMTLKGLSSKEKKPQESFVERMRRELQKAQSDSDTTDDEMDNLTKYMGETTINRKMVDSSDETLSEELPVTSKKAETKKSQNIPDSPIESMSVEQQHTSKTEKKETTEAKTNLYDGASDEDAWCHDATTDEYYLSPKRYSIPGVEWPSLRLPSDLYNRLFAHQKIGIQWMASMHSNKIGGLLGDDMGLGKTYQSLSYVGGLMRAGTIANALVVVPVSVLRMWEKEAHTVIKRNCVQNIQIAVVSSDISRERRCRILREAIRCTSKNPTLIITTYGLISGDYCADFRLEGHYWGYVILDEGHKIKNASTKVAKNCRYICMNDNTRRLLLTGTPIMNDLKELWALFDWCTSGRLLGTIQRFQSQFGKPIENGRQRNADNYILRFANKATDDLKILLRPHFLQRMKTELGDKLPGKQEFVVWTHLSPMQRQLYEEYVSGEHVASVLAGEVTSPLEAVTWLKKLCGHPLLVEFSAATIQREIANIDPEVLLNNSSKMCVLATLISHLSAGGHRTLVFSQSTKTLDIIERVLEGVNLSRIDGSTKEKDRQRFVDEFNSPSSTVDVMLVSTKAGGLGLTLTGASRAIIFDPSWNPAEDSQAVDRCYRIGQLREVQVFRLITSGTVEEKMYEKQVHKDGIRRAVITSSGNSTARFFDRQELSKLFQLAPAGECEVLKKLGVVDSRVRSGPLLSHPGVVGVSTHDNVFENAAKAAGDVPSETNDAPFAGTPAKKVFGRSQRVLLGVDAAPQKTNVLMISKGKENCVVSIDENSCNPKRDVDSDPVSTRKIYTLDTVSSMLQEAQSSIDRGEELEAMTLLLDVLEKESPLREEKILLHSTIANLANAMSWH